MCQGGVWTGSDKSFAGFGKGIPNILLIIGEFGRGDMLEQTVQNLARTRKSQKCSQRSQEAPRASQKL